jgi:triphosphoribosyl-dephospho-CoA synthetase
MRRGTHTAAAKVIAADAKKEYADKRKAVDSLMKRLAKALTTHDREFRKDDKNWGSVGDLGHVESELHDIVRFLRG